MRATPEDCSVFPLSEDNVDGFGRAPLDDEDLPYSTSALPLPCVMQVASLRPCDMLRLVQERRFYSADEMARMTPDQRAAVIDAATCHSWDEVPEPFRSEVLSTARELAQRFGDAH